VAGKWISNKEIMKSSLYKGTRFNLKWIFNKGNKRYAANGKPLITPFWLRNSDYEIAIMTNYTKYQVRKTIFTKRLWSISCCYQDLFFCQDNLRQTSFVRTCIIFHTVTLNSKTKVKRACSVQRNLCLIVQGFWIF